MFDDDNPPRTISFPEAPALPSVSRERIALLRIETELCPHAMKRVLGILADKDALPFTISARRDDRIQCIEIALATPSDRQATTLLHALRRVHNLRRAHFLVPTDHDGTAQVTAKL